MITNNSTRHTRFNNLLILTIIDIGCIGNPFTWHNECQNDYAIYVRLDRALVNNLWLKLHPNAILTNFPPFGSDHGPILLHLSTANSIKNTF